MRGREALGLAVAALLIGAAAVPGGFETGTWILVVLGFVVATASVASHLPLLDRLPIFGAAKIAVEFEADGRRSLLAHIRRSEPFPFPEHVEQLLGEPPGSPPFEPRTIHLQVGIRNEGRATIRDATVTFMHPEYLSHAETDEHGRESGNGRWMPPTSESLVPDPRGRPIPSAYWVRSVDLHGRTSGLIWFKLTIAQPGDYPVRVKITSPDIRRPVVADDVLRVTEVLRGAEPPVDKLAYVIQDGEDAQGYLESPTATVDKTRVMAIQLDMHGAVPEAHPELDALITNAKAAQRGPQTGDTYLLALLTAKLHAAYEVRRRLGRSEVSGDDSPPRMAVRETTTLRTQGPEA